MYRWLIDEIIAKYVLEPTLADVYVEGESDARIVSFVLDKCGASTVAYSIDLVDLNADRVFAEGFKEGNRGRVMALASILARELAGRARKIMCVIDTDHDLVLGKSVSSPFLDSTDFCDLGMYVYERSGLLQAARTSTNLRESEVSTALSDCETAAATLFALLGANKALGWNMKKVALGTYVDVKGTSLRFKREAYVTAYLLKNGRGADRAEFEKKVAEIDALLGKVVDVRNKARSHDLFAVVGRFFRKRVKDTPLGTEAGVGVALKCWIRPESIAAHPLFQRMLRLGAP